jgi:hypothetical protein
LSATLFSLFSAVRIKLHILWVTPEKNEKNKNKKLNLDLFKSGRFSTLDIPMNPKEHNLNFCGRKFLGEMGIHNLK